MCVSGGVSSLVARLGKALGEQEHQDSEELCVRGAGLSFHGQVQFLISRNGHFYFHMCFVLFQLSYTAQLASAVISRLLES